MSELANVQNTDLSQSEHPMQHQPQHASLDTLLPNFQIGSGDLGMQESQSIGVLPSQLLRASTESLPVIEVEPEMQFPSSRPTITPQLAKLHENTTLALINSHEDSLMSDVEDMLSIDNNRQNINNGNNLHFNNLFNLSTPHCEMPFAEFMPNHIPMAAM